MTLDPSQRFTLHRVSAISNQGWMQGSPEKGTPYSARLGMFRLGAPRRPRRRWPARNEATGASQRAALVRGPRGISAATHGVINAYARHGDDAWKASPQWRNRPSWICGRRPGSTFPCGRLSVRVDRSDQQQNQTHLPHPSPCRGSGGAAATQLPFGRIPALSGSHLRGTKPVRPAYPTSTASED
jgi:hypothetical protein